ncbi:hypothetical protein RNAN_2558 [Rheinheimera nanhaiensis E407-8]|uniref:Uncharacterized protein n=1 Tax=Rheinheimera nanhaiensis E407-8 TaxID=562729 RepID=I1DZS4_9GAMM|nr:hypothetical protein RNAN_2558 [Rheinheimera nanhaiensis E407-8]
MLLGSHFLVRPDNLRDRRPDVDAFPPAFATLIGHAKACKAAGQPT